MIQNYKKQGLGETQEDFISNQTKSFRTGIPKSFVIKSKIELDHLTCFICNEIIWKATTCSQPKCFANYCEHCIQNYSSQSPLKNAEEDAVELETNERKCPKCQNKFQKTSIPLINNLLSEMILKCPYYISGCQEQISYDSYLKHALQCSYRKINCEGCNDFYLEKDLDTHRKDCPMIVVSCQKCLMKLRQIDFVKDHSEIMCLELQLKCKNDHLKNIQNVVQQLKLRLNSYQMIIEKIIKGQTIPLAIQFYSSFPNNFYFINNSEVKLSKSSWNPNKQKFDFLHFYVTSPIKTQSPVGFQWKINIKVLKGNLLIGFCSTLTTNSVDFVTNRFGEFKKKQSNQNKYKLIRRANITFSEGDYISFKYLALRKILKIQNETKRLECRLQAKQIAELGENLYSFYSFDTINDCIRFI